MTVLGSLEALKSEYDVVVVGTGLAGTAAALSATEGGARVLLLDKGPWDSAGGSSRFSGGGLRAPQPGYTPDDFYADLMHVTQQRGDQELLRQMVDRAAEDVAWLERYGVRWGDPTKFRPDAMARRMQLRTAEPEPFEHNGVPQIGCGNGLMRPLHRALFDRADVRFESGADRLLVDRHRRIIGVRAYDAVEGYVDIQAPVVILASGGFQANPEMRVRYFGRFADEWLVRGTRFNTGDGIRMALELGAAPAGSWGDFHAPVIDARSAKVECGETNVNTYPFTVMVNRQGHRFLDEGEDFRDRTYAKFGKAILGQPGSIAHLIFDAKVRGIVRGTVHTWEPVAANDLTELASMIGVDSETLARTIADFNRAVQPGEFDPKKLDGKRTVGLTPPKSNWAQPIDASPYYAYTVTGGITFSFGGLRVDREARVQDTEGRPIVGLYAAGEILGGFFYYNYPSGSSLVRAAVYGRIAGGNAAALVQSRRAAGAVR